MGIGILVAGCYLLFLNSFRSDYSVMTILNYEIKSILFSLLESAFMNDCTISLNINMLQLHFSCINITTNSSSLIYYENTLMISFKHASFTSIYIFCLPHIWKSISNYDSKKILLGCIIDSILNQLYFYSPANKHRKHR